MASDAVCWAWGRRTSYRRDSGVSGTSYEEIKIPAPIPKRGHTKGAKVHAVGVAGALPVFYICARCGVVFAEEESDGPTD